MKVDAKNTVQVIKNIAEDSNFKSVLLYGETNSSLEIRYREIVNAFRGKKYEMADITIEDIKNSRGFLVEKFVSTSMFSSGTLFKLKLFGKGNIYSKHIENLFEDTDLTGSNNFLLITSEPLDTSSSLRKYAEKSKYLLCIPCYEENLRDIGYFARRKLAEYNFSFDNKIVEYISSISSCTAAVENEIQKLDLYKGRDRNLTIDDISECLIDTSTADIDNFIENFCSLNMKKIHESLDKILCGGVELIVVVRAMLRHFLLLQRIYFLLARDENLENIFSSEKLFWKLQNSLRGYLKNWNLEKVNYILKEMVEIEKIVKFSQKGCIIFENFLLSHPMWHKSTKIN
ncbi:MAG: DNA polymerase III subunit delta [Rickettsiales bacterium]|jgi:DNA polymerase-3 subunit delta|nr:DNA polymerase III subunit delta [Rickettsiales bacterium]